VKEYVSRKLKNWYQNEVDEDPEFESSTVGTMTKGFEAKLTNRIAID